MGERDSNGTALNSPQRTSAVRRSRNRLLLSEERIRDLVARDLIPPVRPPTGDEAEYQTLDYQRFADALEAAILDQLLSSPQLHAQWAKALPVALGSWARRELTPKSDLDLLFLGDAEAAAAITRHAQEAGLPIRSRIPESLEDLTVGVEAFDTLALLAARGLTEESQHVFSQALEEVVAKLGVRSDRNLRVRKKMLSTLKHERDERQERSNSVAGFLEPNLKYGPGGLRDLGQALQLRALFPHRFEHPERSHAAEVYEYYRRFFLFCRTLSQVGEGGGDLLNAHEQPTLAKWFGYTSSKDFMREVQKGLARVSFYTDVDFAFATIPDAKLEKLRAKSDSFVELAEMLESDPSLMTQAKARDLGFRLFRTSQRGSETEKRKAQQALGRLLTKAIDPRRDENLAIAFFRSRWIDLAVTDFKKIVGYVQHDQYHRYTVDTHLLQALREMKRVCQRPTVLGRLKTITSGLSGEDWTILGWAALYHDVGKGSGGEHSDRSVEIAKQDLVRWGVSATAIPEILWLIENHLELSVAAFRGNPASASTWRSLRAKGVEGKRLHRLAVFTCVDILATNREAYTPWKERLLFDLVKNLETPEALKMAELEKRLRERLPSDWLKALDRLDPFVVASVPVAALAKDLESLQGAMAEAHAGRIRVRVVRVPRENRVWIRFHVASDEPGLFYRMARALQGAGLSVRHASLLSDEQLGVYDWIEVKPPRQLKGLEAKLDKLLAAPSSVSMPAHKRSDGVSAAADFSGTFSSVTLLSQSDSEWVISFRGRDFRGALLRAVAALADLGLSIQWAKVHTWGRQIDDVFGVQPASGQALDEILNRLRSRLGVSQDEISVEV